jgi:hypothetical protein
LALAVPLSRFTSRVGGGSAFFVRQHGARITFELVGLAEVFGGSVLLPVGSVQFRQAGIEFYAIGFSRLTPLGWFGSSRKSGGWF